MVGIGLLALTVGCSHTQQEANQNEQINSQPQIQQTSPPPKDVSPAGRLKTTLEVMRKQNGFSYEIKGKQNYDVGGTPVLFKGSAVETFEPYAHHSELSYSAYKEKVWTVGDSTYIKSNQGTYKVPYISGTSHGSPTEILKKVQELSELIQQGVAPKETVQMKEEQGTIVLELKAEEVPSLKEHLEKQAQKRTELDPPDVYVEKTQLVKYQIKMWIHPQTEQIERFVLVEQFKVPSSYGPAGYTQTTEVSVKGTFTGTINVPEDVKSVAKSNPKF